MFVKRFHTTTITLKAGETQRYRLPPMSQGGVRVQIFHVDEPDDTPPPKRPDPAGVDTPPPQPRPPKARPTSS